MITPGCLLRIAIQAVPSLRYALGVGGIAAVVAIVLSSLKLSAQTAVLGTLAVLVFMVTLLLFSHLAASRRALYLPAKVLCWAFLLITTGGATLLSASIFFDYPKPLRCLLLLHSCDAAVSDLPDNKGARPGVYISVSNSPGAVVAGRDVSIGLSEQAYARILSGKRDEFKAKISRLESDQALLREQLERNIAHITRMLADLRTSLEAHIARLLDAEANLYRLRRYLKPAVLDNARHGLMSGTAYGAEDAFSDILRASDTADAAEAAYQLGALAEGVGDLGKAVIRYQEAVAKQPDSLRYSQAMTRVVLLNRIPTSPSMPKPFVARRVLGLYAAFLDGLRTESPLLANPLLTGAVLVTSWERVAPSAGEYDWSYFVNQRARLAPRRMELAARMHFDLPKWVDPDVEESVRVAMIKNLVASWSSAINSFTDITMVGIACDFDFKTPGMSTRESEAFIERGMPDRVLTCRQIIDSVFAAFPNKLVTLELPNLRHGTGPILDFVAETSSKYPSRFLPILKSVFVPLAGYSYPAPANSPVGLQLSLLLNPPGPKLSELESLVARWKIQYVELPERIHDSIVERASGWLQR